MYIYMEKGRFVSNKSPLNALIKRRVGGRRVAGVSSKIGDAILLGH